MAELAKLNCHVSCFDLAQPFLKFLTLNNESACIMNFSSV